MQDFRKSICPTFEEMHQIMEEEIKKASFHWTEFDFQFAYKKNEGITEEGKQQIVNTVNNVSNSDLTVILEKQSSIEGVKSFMKKALSYYREEMKKYLDERQATNEKLVKLH